MHLQSHWQSKKSGTAIRVLFYAVCILYVLSTASFVTDFVFLILRVSNDSICKNTFCLSVVQTRLDTQVTTLSPQLQTDSQLMFSRILIIQATVNGCCDFLAQCILVRINHWTYHLWQLFYWPIISSKIYRCWIVWGRDIRLVIIPSFLAIAYLGQSFYPHLISRFQIFNSSSLAIWLTPYITIVVDEATGSTPLWVNTLIVTSLTASMFVNALVTGLIVFKIIRVFLKVKPIYDSELTLGSTWEAKVQVRHVIFIIIESGMALFAIQLIRVVLFTMPPKPVIINILEYVIVIHQMFNVIIRSVHIYFPCFTDNIYQGITPTIILVRVSMNLSFDDEESLKEATESLCFPAFPSSNPPSDPNTSSIPTHWQLGSQCQPEERSDLTWRYDIQVVKYCTTSESMYTVYKWYYPTNFNFNIIWANSGCHPPLAQWWGG